MNLRLLLPVLLTGCTQLPAGDLPRTAHPAPITAVKAATTEVTNCTNENLGQIQLDDDRLRICRSGY